MGELIDKADLFKQIAELEELARDRVLDTPTNNPCYMRYVAQLNERTALKHTIADAPAIDAEPVVHGRWKPDGDDVYICSVCGIFWQTIDGTPEQNGMRYCPHCGAKMDGGEE